MIKYHVNKGLERRITKELVLQFFHIVERTLQIWNHFGTNLEFFRPCEANLLQIF